MSHQQVQEREYGNSFGVKLLFRSDFWDYMHCILDAAHVLWSRDAHFLHGETWRFGDMDYVGVGGHGTCKRSKYSIKHQLGFNIIVILSEWLLRMINSMKALFESSYRKTV